MLQPADRSQTPTFKEMNRAEILDFLRKNRHRDRFIPEWIEKPQSERLQKLQQIMQQWMEEKVPQQATNAILQIAQSRKSVFKQATPDKKAQLLEEKFKSENFDLIVWEYIRK